MSYYSKSNQIASLFDPLELLEPVIVATKIFFQNLWKVQFTEMTQYRLTNPRGIIIYHIAFSRSCISDPVNLQLHRSADASETPRMEHASFVDQQDWNLFRRIDVFKEVALKRISLYRIMCSFIACLTVETLRDDS